MIPLHSTVPLVPNTNYNKDIHWNDTPRSPRGSPTPTVYYTPTAGASSPSHNEPHPLPYPSTLLWGNPESWIRSVNTGRPSGNEPHPSLLRRLPSSHSFALPKASSGSWSHSTMSSFGLLHQQSSQPSPKSSVVDVTPTPLMLTAEIIAVADNALSKYEDVCLQYTSMEPCLEEQCLEEPCLKELCLKKPRLKEPCREEPRLKDLCREEPHLEEPCPEEPHQPEPHPFSTFTPEQLEYYFVAAIDAKNALQLRKSAVGVDIGNALEKLIPKLHLYALDDMFLSTAVEEIRLIREQCWLRRLRLNLYSLEYLRRIHSRHELSVTEKYPTLFSRTLALLQEKDVAQKAAQQFYDDPYALKENRLPIFQNSQR